MNDPTTATPALSRQRVVEVAIALAEEQGLPAVTLRQVARRLGVTPMALYWHFENKDDLLDAMVGWLYGQMDFSIDPAASWQEQLRAVIEAEIDVLRAYPHTAMLILSRGSTSPNALVEVETVLGILRRAGLSLEDASNVLTYLETLISLVARESLLAPGAETDQGGAWQRKVRDTIRALSPDEFPNIVAAADYLSAGADPDAYYRFGVDLLMAGIESISTRRGSGG